MTCGRCGQVHPKCKAHNRAGNPCGRGKAPGQDVCHNHGAKAPQNLAKAEERMAIAEIHDKLGVPRVIDALDAIEEMVWEAAGNVAMLRALVQELTQRADGISVQTDDDGERSYAANAIAGPTGSTAKLFDAAPHVLVTMYDAERDRLAQYSALALKAGVDERRVRVAEVQTSRLFEAVTTALDAAGLNPQQQEAFRVALAGNLRALGAA